MPHASGAPIEEDHWGDWKEGDFVYMTEEAAREFPDTARIMQAGGKIHTIYEGGVAEINIVTTVKINTEWLTKSENAYDPIP